MSQLSVLKDITQALYHKEQAAIKTILAEESALRSELKKLDQQVREATGGMQSALPMQSIGADVIWLAWVGRTKTRLNIQLAQVLARKSRVMDKVRIAFGKQLVAKKMVEAEERQLSQDQNMIMLETAIQDGLNR